MLAQQFSTQFVAIGRDGGKLVKLTPAYGAGPEGPVDYSAVKLYLKA